MSLRQKLLVAFSVMILPLLVIGVLTLWAIREENLALERLQVGMGKTQIFGELESAIYRQIRKVRDYLTGFDPRAKTEFEWLERVVYELMEDWKRAVSHPEDIELAEDLDRLHDEVSALAQKAFTLAELQQKEEAIRLVHCVWGLLLPADLPQSRQTGRGAEARHGYRRRRTHGSHDRGPIPR